MKKLLCISFCISLLFSCTIIEFEYPQPRNTEILNEFPKELQGNYLVQLKDEEKDTVKNSIQITKDYYKESGNKNKVFLSDSAILKQQNGYYFFNGKDSNEKNWTVVLIKIQENGNLIIYSLFAGDENEDEDLFIEKVNKITPVQSVTNSTNGKDHYINPTTVELQTLVEKNLFKEVYLLVKQPK